jgi:hypothetical protein
LLGVASRHQLGRENLPDLVALRIALRCNVNSVTRSPGQTGYDTAEQHLGRHFGHVLILIRRQFRNHLQGQLGHQHINADS